MKITGMAAYQDVAELMRAAANNDQDDLDSLDNGISRLDTPNEEGE